MIALVRGINARINLHGSLRNRGGIRAMKNNAVRLHFDHLAFIQKDKAIGDRAQGLRIRGDEIFTNAKTDN